LHHQPPIKWHPIQDLPEDWRTLADNHMPSLVHMWLEQARELRASSAYGRFMQEMRHEIAIETGLIERLYTIDRGTIQLLIEHGIDESLIAHNATDKPVSEVAALIRSQAAALDGIFDFVKNERSLSTSFIKQLHQVLTEHQEYVDGIDQFGNNGRFALTRGDWKMTPNNPQRPDGYTHEYAPPEQVSSEMDNLIRWHLQHVRDGVPPEVEAAWLHHRFTQIHPFQDGNGRVARLLAMLVFLRAQWFPLSIRNDDRVSYIDALEQADNNDLKPLVRMFTAAQRKAFKKSLSLSEQMLTDTQPQVSSVIEAITATLQARTSRDRDRVIQTAAQFFALAQSQLQKTRAELNRALQGVDNIAIYVNQAQDDDAQRRMYNQFQVIEGAKKLDYFANLRAFHSWIALRLEETGSRSTHYEILVSIHVLGRVDRGFFAISVLGYWKDLDADGGKIARDIMPLVDEPFQFTSAHDMTALEKQFQTWLERALIVGLETWRRGL